MFGFGGDGRGGLRCRMAKMGTEYAMEWRCSGRGGQSAEGLMGDQHCGDRSINRRAVVVTAGGVLLLFLLLLFMPLLLPYRCCTCCCSAAAAAAVPEEGQEGGCTVQQVSIGAGYDSDHALYSKIQE
jgi:hypothetical protein